MPSATSADPLAFAGVEAALAAASEALADPGGPSLELLDRLHAANRHLRSVDLAVALVQLRHRARGRVDRSAGLAEWPRRVPDRFPDAVGRPPEVTPAELDADVLASGITNHGCLVVRGLLDAEGVRHFVDVIDRAIAAHDERIGGAEATDELRHWSRPFKADPPWKVGLFRRGYVRDSGGVLAVDSPAGMFELLELFETTGLRAVVESYLGERPYIALDKWTLRRVPTTSGTGWHQDGAFLGPRLRAVNTWIALTDCGGDASEAPALDIVPRRFDDVLETGTEGAMFDTFVSPLVVDRERGDLPILRPRFAAGDALLFDDLFLHQTGLDPRMWRERHAIEAWLFAPSTFPDDQIPFVC